MEEIKPESTESYYLQVRSMENVSEIKVFNSNDCSGQHYKKVNSKSQKDFNRSQ